MEILEDDKQILREEREMQELENAQENKINWLEGDFWDSWDKIKGHMKKLWGHKEEIVEDKEKNKDYKWKKFFYATAKDTIRGKPQLIDNVQKNIPLIRLAVNKIKSEDGNATEIKSFFFFDEHFDKRKDGYQKEQFSLDFRLYRVITQDSKEYFILSEKELPNCACNFAGMIIEVEDLAEMNKNLKMKSISKIFILKDFIPDIKILEKEELVKFTKERKITLQDWINCLAYHPIGTYNLFPEETTLLRASWILSGEKDGYPNHLFVMGRTGTHKSMGYVETLANKFSEDFQIFEGGNSRVKGLTPSFKEKPANLGYLAKCEKIGLVDEIGKMIEFETHRHDTQTKNILGELNFLLEHKKRLVGSGNDNDVSVQATAKFMFVTNPVSEIRTIAEHIGLIDATTLSRFFIWVQDEDEMNFVLDTSKSVCKVPPTPKSIENENIDKENRKKQTDIYMCWGELDSRNDFLTLYDSCNNFVSEIDEKQVFKLENVITLMAKEPMKSSVWKPRAIHHITLLVDGLCKLRCLFEDYDSSFIANEKDFGRAEAILTRMVNGWETILKPKEEFRK